MRGNKRDFRRVALLLPLLLATSCAHKKNQAQNPPLAPPIEDVPPSKPNNAPANLPPPVITVPQQEQPPKPATSTPTAQQQPPPPPRKHHKPQAGRPAQNSERAANGTPEVSAIGQLSSGDASDLRTQTADSIHDTEQKLNQIHRKLNDQEQKTAAQIREFLKQAHAALVTGDTDGAYTLSLKAKVLLGELTP